MSVLAIISPFVAAGFSVHWLRANSKAPAESEWSTLPTKTLAQLEAEYRDGLNVGVRLGEWSRVGGGYLHAIDLDIRDDEQVDAAHGALAALFPSYTTLPFVISGSGGESRHFYFISDKPFASRKLARSEAYEMVFDPKKGRAVKKHDWEIDLFGTGKQVVLPPSIHPDTGAEYEWGRPFDLTLLDLGIAPTVPSARIADLVPVSESTGSTDDRPALGLALDEAREHVFGLPLSEWCIDRDGWYQVGMALHHEFAGRGLGGEAFELWCDFSGQSDKFDINDAQRVWRSFKDNKSRNVRMATIMQAARIARFEQAFGEIEAVDDGFDTPQGEGRTAESRDRTEENQAIDDLLGAPSPAPVANSLDDLDDLIEKVPTHAPGLEWKSLLAYGDKGIVTNLPNIALIVANDLRTTGVVAFNEFSERIVRRAEPSKVERKRVGPKGLKQLEGPIWRIEDQVNGGQWVDVHDHSLRDLLETSETAGGYGIKVSDRDLKGAITIAAHEHKFHPVREYLDRLKWDGVPRLERLFIRYFAAPDSAYTRGVARNMMVGAVTRVFEPGHKFDYAVILEGLQGKRKTTFIETLARDWFGELASEFDNPNKMIESMQSAWIIEIPELSGFSKHDVQAIKAFISRRVDRARLAYAKNAQDFHRQCIFIGSTNDGKYLRDETGGRRFWPIECLLDEDDNIDIDGLRAEVDQLWAEARALYRQMRERQPKGMLPLYLDDAEAAAEAAAMQESRRVETVEDVMAGQIVAWLDTPIARGDGFAGDDKVLRNGTCLKQVWVEALGNDPRSFNSVAAQTMGRAMRLVKGWDTRASKQRLFGKYGKQRAYFRSSERGALDRGAEMVF